MSDLEVQLLNRHTPTGQLPQGLRSVDNDVRAGRVVSKYLALVTLQVWLEMFNGLHNTKPIQFGNAIVALVLLERSTSVCDGSYRTVSLFRGEYSS